MDPSPSELMKLASEHSGYLLGIGAGLAALARWWKPVKQFVRDRLMFQHDIREHMDKTDAMRREFMTAYAKDSQRWDKGVEEVKQCRIENAEISKLLRNGISHRLALLTAQHLQAIEASSTPMFICNEEAQNEAVSQGYLDLLGVDSVELLDSTRWKDVITGPLVQSYLDSFTDAVAHRRTFISSVGFQNPFTREDRGVWRVTADCRSVNDALVFTGSFFPEDERANQIAEENSWKMNPDPKPVLPK